MQTATQLQARSFKWVQVLTSIVTLPDGTSKAVQLIGTTESDDRLTGLDTLLLRHIEQLQRDFSNTAYKVSIDLTFMNSNGEMSKIDSDPTC